jgi:Family of unknown function (DUF5675)
MRSVTLTRTETGDDGTFGHIMTDSGLCLRSGELPWRDNEPGHSSIPIGTYEVVWALSPTRGWCYHVIKVADRIDIEIHPANFCGDRTLSLKSDLEGCICLGMFVGPMNGQKAILESRKAFLLFENDLDEQPFELTIVSRY